jgi:hypothetical protein
VARPLPIGTPQTAEGAITGDDRYIYVAAVDQIVRLDPRKPDFDPFPMPLSISLLDKKANYCVVSGMASNGRELFIADSRANLIRVEATATTPTYQVAIAANDGIRNAPALVAVPDAPGYAPAAVYQSQRVGEGYRYTLPGFTPGAIYRVRCHLAEYEQRPANADPRNRVISINGVEINVAEAAGGVLKAYYRDFPNCRADAKGNVTLDCGSYGDLWIVQRGNDMPAGLGTSAKYPAAVKCYRADGTFTGRQILDVVNPRAVGYDAAGDRLLVAETGPDMNVRIYSGLSSAPKLVQTFGAKGGIYSGGHPGLVRDPASGDMARFAGIAGLGVDAAGNLYVGGGFQGTDLRSFTPDGRLVWMVHSLMFCNTYDVDPTSNGAEIYGAYSHVHLDLSKTAPGSEQRYLGYNWDLCRYLFFTTSTPFALACRRYSEAGDFCVWIVPTL